jgi:hypothetical protein
VALWLAQVTLFGIRFGGFWPRMHRKSRDIGGVCGESRCSGNSAPTELVKGPRQDDPLAYQERGIADVSAAL